MRWLILLALLCGAFACTGSVAHLHRSRLVVKCNGHELSQTFLRPGPNVFMLPDRCRKIEFGVEP